MQQSQRPQLVIDTNVWISGLVFGGRPKDIIQLFLDGSIVVIVSEELLSELRRKISQKFPLFAPQLPLLEASIRERAIAVQLGNNPIAVSRDPNDNMVLETAIAGNASYIVSGDKDLLVLESHETVRILKPAEYLELYIR